MSCDEHILLSRRRLLVGGASLALWGMAPRLSFAGARDPRLLTIVLRGGLDGLSMVAPLGDPDYERLRGELAVPKSGANAGLPLDNFFALNAGMPHLHALYKKGEALFVHAVASPYRGRSHFDGQDVLESGLPSVGRAETGWLNRALASLPSQGRAQPMKGLAIGAVVPLVMRGTAPVMSWIDKTSALPLRPSTIERLMDLYANSDPALAKAFAEGIATEDMTKDAAASPHTGPRRFRAFIEAAEAANKFLRTEGGPRIGALSYNGWDTHANEGAVTGNLATALTGLDQAIETLATGLGPAWKDTVIVILTEFGRTARINGTRGTDHGTATVAILVGGAVKGGRVIANWPGLNDKALFQGRDLAPTRDARSLLKGVLRDHLGMPDGLLASAVFPESGAVGALDGLVAAPT